MLRRFSQRVAQTVLKGSYVRGEVAYSLQWNRPAPILPSRFPSLSGSLIISAPAESTTVRSDYQPPPREWTAAKRIEPLPPASVIHKNACFAQIEGFLTQTANKPTPYPRIPNVQSACAASSMHATNFKMDADRRLETHCTTHRDGYRPVLTDNLHRRRLGRPSNPGPLGNKIHGCTVGSEYSTAFAIDKPGIISLDSSAYGGCSVSGVVKMSGKSERRNTITGRLLY